MLQLFDAAQCIHQSCVLILHSAELSDLALKLFDVVFSSLPNRPLSFSVVCPFSF